MGKQTQIMQLGRISFEIRSLNQVNSVQNADWIALLYVPETHELLGSSWNRQLSHNEGTAGKSQGNVSRHVLLS